MAGLVREKFSVVCSCAVIVLLGFSPVASAAQPPYDIVPVTSGATDHRWPSINNLGHLVWSEKDASGFWQVIKCLPKNLVCDASNMQQITSGGRNHERPVISDDGTIAWFQDNSGGGIGYQVIRREPSGTESVVELSTRNNQNGDQRIAGHFVGMSSDSRTISYYTFTGTLTRRYNVSGIGELTDGGGGRGNFIFYTSPDINKEGVIVYASSPFGGSDAPVPNGSVFKATIANPFQQTRLDTGSLPKVADGPNQEVVYLKSGRVVSTIGGEVDDGSWADVNVSGTIVFEKPVGANSQVFIAQKLRAELLDPVPDFGSPSLSLLDASSTFGVTQDVDQISRGGRAVAGIGADGASRLVVRLGAQSAGEQFDLTILNEAGNPSRSPDEDGFFNSGSSATVAQALMASNNRPVAWVVYQAPRDFVRPNGAGNDASRTDREIKIRVQSRASGIVKDIPVNIVRPPVVLVHGLWSEAATWDHFGDLFFLRNGVRGHDARFQVYTFDYSGSNAATFRNNGFTMYLALKQLLPDFKATKNVAATQFDVVVHSMGGLVTRTMASFPTYLRPNNFQKGDVHKLITVDSPHAGSNLATYLLGTRPWCKWLFWAGGNTISDPGAVGDLVPGSGALSALASVRPNGAPPLRAHVIAGLASPTQTGIAELVFSARGGGNLSLACAGLLPAGGYSAVYNEPNDLLVGKSSMLARPSGVALTASGRPVPSDEYQDLIHTVNAMLFPAGPDVLGRVLRNGNEEDAADMRIPARVLDLLNEPANGPMFESILPGGL